MRPDPTVTQIFEYLLAVACAKFDIDLHAFVAMSNHYHLVVTDNKGRVPDFEQYLNSLLARSINALRGRSGHFWDAEPPSRVERADEETVLDAIAYTVANPVSARLVGHANEWEGASSARWRFGHRHVVARPKGFFGRDMPSNATLRIVRPQIYQEHSDDAVMQLVVDRVRQKEQLSKAESVKPLTMHRVLRQHWNDSPPTPRADSPGSSLVAARSRWVRMAAQQFNKLWLERYQKARERFLANERDVEWPPGTYWMCVRLGLPTAPC